MVINRFEMKNNIIFKKGWLLLLVLGIALVYSCKKEDPNEGLEAPRIFKPSGITVRTTETDAKITWTAPLLTSNLKLAYAAEFSQDSTFVTSEFSMQTDTSGLLVADDKLKVRKKYYVRVKALSLNGQPESNWMVSRSFSISGEQFFSLINELEILETQVTLRWKVAAGLDKITLQKKDAAMVDYPINATEAAAGLKVITGLDAGSEYTAEIWQGAKSKGIRTFETLKPTVYATILNPGDDIVAAITNAANGDVIGLNPGTYLAGTSNYSIIQKAITLKSTSSDPKNTKVTFKEFILNGTGAGIKFNGIELDGTPSGSAYFLNLVSGNSNADAANFEPIELFNCIVRGATTSFLRADRGSAASTYKMDHITISNTLVYDIGSTLGYHFLHLNKLQFAALNIRKSTFYNVGRALITNSTVLTSNPPVITIDYSTFNNLGAGNHYVLLDAGANPVRFNVTNSIIANVPRVGATVNAAAVRATGAGSGVVFSNNNTFNFVAASGGATLTFPTNITIMSGNQSTSLGWTNATTTFQLPADSPLRTASSEGGAIGDPRWTF